MPTEREIALEEENARLRSDITTLVTELNAEINGLEAENARLRQIGTAMDGRICQILGRALGYPRYADDQAVFPGATDADGACAGEFVAEDLAAQAAARIAQLEALPCPYVTGTTTQYCTLPSADWAMAWNVAIEAAVVAAEGCKPKLDRLTNREAQAVADDRSRIYNTILSLKKESPDVA